MTTPPLGTLETRHSNVETTDSNSTPTDRHDPQHHGTEQASSTDDALRKRGKDLGASETALNLEQNRLRLESQQPQRKLDAQCRDSAALERQVHGLRLQRSEGDKELKKQITALTARVNAHEDERLRAYQSGIIEGVRTQSTPAERTIMLQQADAYKAEAMRWKSEAFRQGSRVISQCWQASVDEAVRREREKDSAVIKALRDEIAAFRAEKKG